LKTYSSLPQGEHLSLIACDLCGSKAFHPVWDCENYRFVVCEGCGVHYQNPQPVQDELLLRYGDQYFAYERENEAAFLHLMLLGLQDVGFEDLVGTKNLKESSKTFLDVGCATGLLLDHQRSRGWAVKGVEVCRPSAEYGRTSRGLDIWTGTLEEARFPSESFDVVHFSHLIEHLNSPLNFLREVARILRPGGWAIVTTPNTDGWQARWFKASWRSAIADHLYLFSKKNLKQALTKTGFHVKRVKSWGGLAQGAKPRLLKPVLDRLVKVLGTGDVMLMAAQKLSW
jgi:2-polyprenyl-3-methyl-5-hydroxy-6-metoxy-1,4-benzoquinol methylase